MSQPDNHRHCFLLTGSTEKVLSEFLKLSKNLSCPLISAHDIEHFESLNVGTFRTRSFKQIRQELGATHEAVLVDLTHGISASALAILAGTVRGGGVFAIALPDHDWLPIIDKELPRHLPWPYEAQQIDSTFKRYFLSHLLDNKSPFLKWPPDFSSLPTCIKPQDSSRLTKQQQLVQQTLINAQTDKFILIAPRGRGKSTVLGDTIAKLLKDGKQVALTAPNQDAISTLKSRFEAVNNDLNNANELPFFAPDALLQDSKHWDYLFVDEAAMIPVPLLTELNDKATVCIFSTTNYGYEGAGKGFGIRFCQHLESQQKAQKRSVQYLSLSTPIRWGENDPLENWINKYLFLGPSSSILKEKDNQTKLFAKSPLHKTLIGQEWLVNQELLASTFHLLINAHYQTSPDNLRWILDDPSVSTWLTMSDNRTDILSVAVITVEGDLPEDLCKAVLEGTRRPRGHLVPQSLLAHEGIQDAGQYTFWRISRIATEQTQQGKGLGSNLLQTIEAKAKDYADFLCTSFAATTDVVAFWLKNGFIPIRLGTTKDQSSGSYSLMMVKPLTEHTVLKAEEWQQGFIEHFALNLLLQYKDIPTDLIMLILCRTKQYKLPKIIQLSSKELLDLDLFINANRPFESIRAVFFKATMFLLLTGQLDRKSPTHKMMVDAALGRKAEISAKESMIKGKKAMQLSFKETFKKMGEIPSIF